MLCSVYLVSFENCFQDSDVHITYEDQQKINKFARLNAKMEDLKQEIAIKKVILLAIPYLEL